MRFFTKSIIGCCMLLLISSQAFAQSNPLIGVWLTDVKSHLTIKICQEGLCGYITKVSIRPKLYEKNKQEIDRVGIQNAPDYFNKDPDLRSRRLLGLQVLMLDKQEAPTVFSGKVYNPEDGRTYSGKLELINKNQLRLTGCAFLGIICQSEDWYRVSASR